MDGVAAVAAAEVCNYVSPPANSFGYIFCDKYGGAQIGGLGPRRELLPILGERKLVLVEVLFGDFDEHLLFQDFVLEEEDLLLWVVHGAELRVRERVDEPRLRLGHQGGCFVLGDPMELHAELVGD